MNKVISTILSSILFAPFAFGYESCITPKTQKVDLYGTVLEKTLYSYTDEAANPPIRRKITQLMLKLETTICAISDAKKDAPELIYDINIALIPSAGINLSKMLGAQVELRGVVVLDKTGNRDFPLGVIVESIKIIH